MFSCVKGPGKCAIFARETEGVMMSREEVNASKEHVRCYKRKLRQVSDQTIQDKAFARRKLRTCSRYV